MELNLKSRTGVIRLNSGHSLFLGNKPPVITNEMLLSILGKEERGSTEQFGLFETATPNYTTYYPDVTPEDLTPKDEDFIYPIFRALSATVVWKGYKPIDFSKPGVLKAAMNLLVGQSINVDHETAVGNAIGSVKSTVWQESYTDKGVKVPAGINAEFMIDGKSNPRLARGIQMDPPAIHSNSVSVRFEWEPSHTLKNDEDFFSKLGTKDEKGNLYRLIVTRIVQFSETSLVSHGADAFAQIIRDGKIHNPVYASGVYNFSSKDDKGHKINYSHSIDYKTDLLESLSQDTILDALDNNENDNKNQLNMDILEILSKKLSKNLTEENFSEELQAFLDEKETANLTAVSTVQTKLDEATTEITDLTAKLGEAEPKATKFDTLLLSKVEDAKRLYKLSKGEKADEAILSMLEGQTDIAVLDSLTKGYSEEVNAKFPDTCKSCGGTEINKASSFNEDEEDDKGPKGGNEILTNAEAREKLRAELKKKN